ncbi:MalM family protein [Photobacterium alginatilyticum]|uniref:Transcriptional regulator n=1 Tax=Photobacterium alginatilyticum TaxID=1775171 RepID=A0ABW9YJS9_9GAMM|nr:MalM family protein [Photobacterium alginatilyticum]NBI54015.1 transcriptional regulator [Photobacterium alginatilyticum]
MKIIKTTLAALLAASLLGCTASPSTELTKDIAVAAPICCNSFSEFSWVPMNGDKIDFIIDDYSQVSEFAEGKSYFAAFAIPRNIERLQVDVKSWMKIAGVFAPKVILLDPEFQIVKTIALDDFDVMPANLFSLSSYQHRIVMDQQTTPYMVIYSPLDYREGEITIPHPERLRAEELGLARPMVTDPVIQHQKFGSLELDLKPLNLRSYRADEFVVSASATAPVSKKAPVKAPTTAVVAPVPVAAAASTQQSSTNTVSTPAMLPETEAFYNSQIKAAVEKNDMHKALQLLEEAKRAGSRSAETTFVELIKK